MTDSKNTPSNTTLKIRIPEPYATVLNWLIEYSKKHPVQESGPEIQEERGDGFIKITVRMNHS